MLLLPCKGQHDLVMRTLFGTLTLESPRFYTCACQEPDQQSFSPLAELLPERTTPERRYQGDHHKPGLAHSNA